MFSKITSLRDKIFIAIVVLNLLFMTFMAAFNFYRYGLRMRILKKQELVQTENKVKETYRYILKENHGSSDFSDEKIRETISNKIFELANVNNVAITLYDLQGRIITSSRPQKENLASAFLQKLLKTKSIVKEQETATPKNSILYSSWSYLNYQNKPIAIISTETTANKSSWYYHFKILLKQHFLAIIFLLILSGYAAWYISKGITKKIVHISKTLQKTNVEYLETPIEYSDRDEIKPLVDSYNIMLEKLQEQTSILARTEREEAWRDMARQIAHEINNPLTPLKLSVQNFQRKYNPEDENN